jgi:GNAT superfamily N-acetyltransferase
LRVKLTFEWHVGREVSEGLKQECIDLFSRHYGVWGEAAGPQRAGKWVGFRLKQMSELMSGQDARLAVARVDGALAGYAAAVQPIVPGHGTMSWVTQLVVHAEYRKQGIAKRLLFSIWGFSDHFAWGLVTSSPYAARALEKTTRRRLSPERIAAGLPSILAGTEGVPYVKPETETLCDGESSRVNSRTCKIPNC